MIWGTISEIATTIAAIAALVGVIVTLRQSLHQRV